MRVLLGVMLLGLVGGVGLVTPPPAAAADTYVIAMDTDYAPFEYETTTDQVVGIDVDLIHAIADYEGFDITIKPMSFDAALQAVRDGQADAVMSAMTITEERKQEFDFTDPYFQFGVQMAVAKGNDDIRSYDDLRGKRVVVLTDSTGLEFAESVKERYGFTISTVEEADAMFDEVRNGNADALFDEHSFLRFDIETGTELKTVTPPEPAPSFAGVAVKKGTHTAFLRKFNSGLLNLKATDGYDDIVERYLGSPVTPDFSLRGWGRLLGEWVAKLLVPLAIVLLLWIPVLVRRLIRGLRSSPAGNTPPVADAPPIEDAPPTDDVVEDAVEDAIDPDDAETRVQQLEPRATPPK